MVGPRGVAEGAMLGHEHERANRAIRSCDVPGAVSGGVGENGEHRRAGAHRGILDQDRVVVVGETVAERAAEGDDHKQHQKKGGSKFPLGGEPPGSRRTGRHPCPSPLLLRVLDEEPAHPSLAGLPVGRAQRARGFPAADMPHHPSARRLASLPAPRRRSSPPRRPDKRTPGHRALSGRRARRAHRRARPIPCVEVADRAGGVPAEVRVAGEQTRAFLSDLRNEGLPLDPCPLRAALRAGGGRRLGLLHECLVHRVAPLPRPGNRRGRGRYRGGRVVATEHPPRGRQSCKLVATSTWRETGSAMIRLNDISYSIGRRVLFEGVRWVIAPAIGWR